ncbi:MAG TPA: alkaline phosphatase family protein [Xanthobacteraceae bacterium]|nr:alkaline phosphatase family protein [Xanthobacteraceae bacterium]
MKSPRISGCLAKILPVLVAVLVLSLSNPTTSRAAHAAPTPKPKHVFIIILENEGYDVTFGRHSPAVYLKWLAGQGALLRNYYGIGHNSLDNYLAMASGQAPNPVTQDDCQNYADFTPQAGPTEYGQARGEGCIFPSSVSTVANQLEQKQLTWKGYMEDMGNNPNRERATCGQPVGTNPDSTQHAEKDDQYAARHNPFVYFHAIIDNAADCSAHVVNFSALATDLKDISTTPNYVFITPNLCHDAHDPTEKGKPCANGEPGGLTSANKFLKENVPMILAAPAFRQDGLLIVTFDESDLDYGQDPATKQWKLVGGDASACCKERPGPNIRRDAIISGRHDLGPGIIGPGGGRIGAVLVSPYIKPGTVSKVPYNHYAMLRSIEDFFGLDHLGYAAQTGLKSFGKDIFNKPKE